MSVKSVTARAFILSALSLVLALGASPANTAEKTPGPPVWVGIYTTSGKVGLKWTRAAGAARYKVYRSRTSGKGHAMAAATTDVSYIDADVRPGETYYYVLKSVGSDGSESAFSEERYIKVPLSGGGLPVTPPEWVGALVEEKRIKLAWLPSPSSNTLAYNIYRSLDPGKGFQLVGSTQDTGFTDTDVVEGQTYYYALTALDKEFKETKYSETRQVAYQFARETKPELPPRAVEPEAVPEKVIAKRTTMVRFITRGKENVPLNSPTDIDIAPDGSLYVSDTGSSCIYVFGPDGEYMKSISGYGSEDGKFIKLIGLDVDSGGFVYGADAYNGRMQKFNPKGELVMAVNMNRDVKSIARDLGLDEPISEFGIVKVLVAKDGRLYAIDNYNNCVVIYSSNGSYIRAFGGQGKGDGKFQGPTFAVFDKAGNLYVTDCFNARIQVFDPEGTFKWKFGSYGNILGTFSRPKGLTVDDEGRIYVSDSMTNAVQVFGQDGAFLYLLGDERGKQIDLGTPNGIVVDKKRRIYMVEKLLNRVQIRQIGE